MTAYEFIFSNKLKHRLTRHFTFWLAYYLRFVGRNLPEINSFINSDVYLGALFDALRFFPIYLFSVYITIYFILPKYLEKRNKLFLVVAGLLLFAITILSAYLISRLSLDKNAELIPLFVRIGVNGFIAVTSCAIIIKIMKDYFFQQRKNEMLEIEHIRSTIGIMKMQLHPTFLFECLDNICTDIEQGTKHAPEMILKLAELLSYVIYEGELQQVPLAKEIEMFQTYIDLKKLEYKNKLHVQFTINGNIQESSITPVLFLPLFEIILIPFKNIQKQHPISVNLTVAASKLLFILENNVPGNHGINSQHVQTKLDDIRERLHAFQLYKFKLEHEIALNNFSIRFQSESMHNYTNHTALAYEST